MFNESKGFASVGIHKQGNISEPIFINITAGIHWVFFYKEQSVMHVLFSRFQ